MIKYSNDELLTGIQQNNSVILRYIYNNFYGKINAFIKSNNGDESDANDIFQESIIIIYRKIKSKSLVLNEASFETYLYSVCRLLWLKQLDKRKKNIVKVDELHQFADTAYDDDLLEVSKKNEKYKLYQEHFAKLGDDCQKILKLFFDKVPLKEIADRMGFASESYAKKRKHKCKEYLVRSIKQDSEFKSIVEDDLY